MRYFLVKTRSRNESLTLTDQTPCPRVAVRRSYKHEVCQLVSAARLGRCSLLRTDSQPTVAASGVTISLTRLKTIIYL